MERISQMRLPHVIVSGMPVALVSDAELSSAMLDDVERRRNGKAQRALTVFDANAYGISLYDNDPQFAKAIDSADIVHADGQIVVWASKFGRGSKHIPERTATTDFIHSAAKAAAEHDIGYYLLGGTEDINRSCAEKLKELHPGLNIAGRRNGYFDDSEVDAVIADINASKADVLWVGLGKPKEQFFSLEIASRLNHCAWVVTCGGCFHYVVGDYARAPIWMQKIGLEWLHRTATGPTHIRKRHFRRYPHTISVVLKKDILKLK
ncbi:WecB/TagA/CpsF family glycosyltransferase [Ruegeria sp. A3M17]|uniref:WecB/TagA/CpsF family glycosyltransferase n=1 Tax=Ruegeria sp. A3M17 TaxID=2267229 RepID=UPI000DE98DA8|nr:WecB/TagA/CpsF family glycosyltransferase [Ruegeria sp. A3M17]RBW54930.1 glycosyltransferase [Ruegeria sp. A3M17]